ncbi:MAG: nucleotidyltransferase family protein [Actinomycetota bacterium]|nr:nucleotidyltransferase family protein [Actinomycetota bacterium]
MAEALEKIAAAEAERSAGSSTDQAEAEQAFLEVLDQAIEAVEGSGVPYLLMGGIASAALGRPRYTQDVDIFVRPQEGRVVLDALDDAGFETEERFPHWLYKGYKDGQMVDVIFRSTGDIYLDDEMLARAVVREFKGRSLSLVPPEDMVVIKAIAHDEYTPRHWHDALAIVAACRLDWEYLLSRARRGARRVLSLLLYAQGNDLIVPDDVIRSLFQSIYEGEVS